MLLTRDRQAPTRLIYRVISFDSYPLEASCTMKLSSTLPTSHPSLCRLGDHQSDSSSFALCTLQVLPGHGGPPSGPPSARTGHAQKCVDKPDSSGLRKTLPYATHGAHRGGDRGPLFPLALPAASHAALPPGDLPCARISALTPSKAPTPPQACNAIPPPRVRLRVRLRPPGSRLCPEWVL